MPTLIIDNPTSKNEVANWAEFYLCATGLNLSKAELASYIESSSGTEPDSAFIDDVWQELSVREYLYGDTPPYSVDNREVRCTIDWETFPEYLVCLILTLDGAAENSSATGKLFERLSCEAVKNYFGGNAIIYGFPSKQSVTEIAGILNERFNFEPTSNFKDRGVDIIAWKPFGDHRRSQLVCLLQCAAGFNWKKKLLEVPLDAWKSYISWGSSLPIKGFAAPVVIDESIFHETIMSAGLMFDRPRIYRYTQSAPYFNSELRKELVSWCFEKMDI